MFLVLGELGGVAELEKGGSEFDEPLGVDGRHFAHVFFRRHHQLVVDHPFRLPGKGGNEKGPMLKQELGAAT